MKLPIETSVINLNSQNAANEIKDALGISDGDTIEIMTPQFNRVDDTLVRVPDKDEKFFKSLCTFSDTHLSDLGLQKWDETECGALWLFPYQWYGSIPEGFEVTAISGRKEQFANGITNDGVRFGALAYGIFKDQQ